MCHLSFEEYAVVDATIITKYDAIVLELVDAIILIAANVILKRSWNGFLPRESGWALLKDSIATLTLVLETKQPSLIHPTTAPIIFSIETARSNSTRHVQKGRSNDKDRRGPFHVNGSRWRIQLNQQPSRRHDRRCHLKQWGKAEEQWQPTWLAKRTVLTVIATANDAEANATALLIAAVHAASDEPYEHA